MSAERDVSTRTEAPAGARVLVIGGSPDVMQVVLQELEDAGVAADGSVEPERAMERYDARELDLIALGGGLSPPLREALKQHFRARHPRVRLLDTWAPQAAYQIVQALEADAAVTGIALDAYLDRIGYTGPRAPSLDTLRALQQAHLARIPFEAIDVLMARGVDLSPAAVDAKLILRRRGGYCFEQNGLFRRALEAMGFEVEGLLARVRLTAVPGSGPAAATHQALRVSVDGERWLVDVGFGGAVPPQPLRFDAPEPQNVDHETFRIIPFGQSRLLQARLDDRWASLYQVLPEPAVPADYEAGNWYTSTHPASPFRRMLIAARTTPDARYALRDNRFTVRTRGGGTERRCLDADGIEEVLRATFALPVAEDWRPVIEAAVERGGEDGGE